MVSPISRSHALFRESWRWSDPCPDQCLCHNPSKQKVSQILSEFADNSPPEYHHAVYVLECKYRSKSKAEGVAKNQLGRSKRHHVPEWVESALKADRRFYVGETDRARDEILDHAKGTRSEFTTIFPPAKLWHVKYYPNRTGRTRVRNQIVDDLRSTSADLYVAHS